MQTKGFDGRYVLATALSVLAGNAAAAEPGAQTSERVRSEICLAQAIHYEAANESRMGREAVAQVVLNRLGHPAFPKTVCGVVYQGSRRTTGCQFSFTCDGSLGRPPSAADWAEARDVAIKALDGHVAAIVGDAINYHAAYVSPYWAPSLSRVAQVGAHIFYRRSDSPTGQRQRADPASPASAARSVAGSFSAWGIAIATVRSDGHMTSNLPIEARRPGPMPVGAVATTDAPSGG